MPRVVHFEICADDPARATKFYSKVFGWKIEKWPGSQEYWLASTGTDTEMGINGAIMKRPDPKAATINTIGVGSVDDFAARVTRNGGKVLTAKMPIPGVGYFAYCLDTEGNQFGIMQPDTSAK